MRGRDAAGAVILAMVLLTGLVSSRVRAMMPVSGGDRREPVPVPG
jgi:hypothetical protein